MSSIFLERTRELLKNRPKHITLKLIAEETNLGKPWLDSLLYKKDVDEDQLFDPGVRKIETLYNYLADQPFSFENKVGEIYEEVIEEDAEEVVEEEIYEEAAIKAVAKAVKEKIYKEVAVKVVEAAEEVDEDEFRIEYSD